MKSVDKVGCCALYCGNCFLLKADVADSARDLLRKLEAIGFEEWGPALAGMTKEVEAFGRARECLAVLKAWELMRCAGLCKRGGGSADCPIRKCCVEKKIDGCWECDRFEDCKTLAWLRPVGGEMNIRHIRMIREKGIEAFVSEMEKKETSSCFEISGDVKKPDEK